MLWPKPHGVIAAAPLIRTLTERRVGVNSPAVAGGGPPNVLDQLPVIAFSERAEDETP